MTLAELQDRILKTVNPYHTNNGNDPNGCPHLCGVCRDRRNIRDAVLRLFEELKESNNGFSS